MNDFSEEEIEQAIMLSIQAETERASKTPVSDTIEQKVDILRPQSEALKIRAEIDERRLNRMLKEQRDENSFRFRVIDDYFQTEMGLKQKLLVNTKKLEGDSLIYAHFNYHENLRTGLDTILTCIKLFGYPTDNELSAFRPAMYVSDHKQACKEMYFLEKLKRIHSIVETQSNKGIGFITDLVTREIVDNSEHLNSDEIFEALQAENQNRKN